MSEIESLLLEVLVLVLVLLVVGENEANGAGWRGGKGTEEGAAETSFEADFGALSPGGCWCRFSACAVGDLKRDVRPVPVVETPFVPSSCSFRKSDTSVGVEDTFSSS